MGDSVSRRAGSPRYPIRGQRVNGHLHNWAPIQMPDYTILYFIGEDADGNRSMDEAVRVYPDPARDHQMLLPSRHDIKFEGISTRVQGATLYFTETSGHELTVQV